MIVPLWLNSLRTHQEKMCRRHHPRLGSRSADMANRKRDIPIMVRLTSEEKELIQQKMQEFGTTNMEAYFRKMAIDGYVIHLDLSDVRELITQLRRYGNNLNQLTKRAHQTGNIYAADLEQLFQNHQHMFDAAREILTRLASI